MIYEYYKRMAIEDNWQIMKGHWGKGGNKW